MSMLHAEVIVHLKMIFNQEFTHPYAILGVYDLLSSAKHKSIIKVNSRVLTNVKQCACG